MTRRNLNEYESGELSFHEELTNQIEMDIQTNRLKHKVIFNQMLGPQNHLIVGNKSLSVWSSEIQIFLLILYLTS